MYWMDDESIPMRVLWWWLMTIEAQSADTKQCIHWAWFACASHPVAEINASLVWAWFQICLSVCLFVRLPACLLLFLFGLIVVYRSVCFFMLAKVHLRVDVSWCSGVNLPSWAVTKQNRHQWLHGVTQHKHTAFWCAMSGSMSVWVLGRDQLPTECNDSAMQTTLHDPSKISNMPWFACPYMTRSFVMCKDTEIRVSFKSGLTRHCMDWTKSTINITLSDTTKLKIAWWAQRWSVLFKFLPRVDSPDSAWTEQHQQRVLHCGTDYPDVRSPQSEQR